MDTFTTNKIKKINIEDIKKACDMILKKEEKELPKGFGWFSKIMNRYGWHRKYEVLIIDRTKLQNNYFDMKSFIIKTNSPHSKGR